jgi:NADH:ubiquinone oxidoreductase subunit F (NADH-binding)/NADH:ubiquinone oxidoreductase subunit E
MNNNIPEIVDQIIREKGRKKDAVIPVLQAIQNKFNYLPQEALEYVCETSDITASQIMGISTFYSQFRHKPVGKHIIKVCVGTACHVKGALLVYDSFKRALKLEGNEDTDAKGLFTMEKVACLGCCTIAPVVQIDNITYGNIETEKVSEVLEDFISAKSNPDVSFVKIDKSKDAVQGEIRVGLGSCCVASGSADVKRELEKTLSNSHIHVDVKQVGCVGVCNQVPLLEIHAPNKTPVFYSKIKPEEVKQIIHGHFKPNRLIYKLKDRFLLFFENMLVNGIPNNIKRYPSEQRDTPIAEFLNGQISIATEHRGELKPADIEEYKKFDGFAALKKCLKEYSPQQVIDIILKSGLKGRGGGGFPSGIKWKLVKEANSDKKYIICNGDEGDPGAFMDRMLLESYPFRVIEGMLIAAYAVGATEGIFYIRAEYPLAVTRIKEAISIVYKDGLLGKNILGSDFSILFKVFEGAGAFVCGEETALIASVEGKRGLPSMRPPFPAEKGLWEKPTLINNTETLALVPWIIRNGADEFSKIGTANSKGTKVFALAGKIRRGGLIEVPMGTSIRQVIEDIGGGIANGKQFKAVQIGGPSGGCIPASLSETPIDFESLEKLGAMMGSGGLIVLDESDCMVDIAKYFLSFTQDQSCGKCTFCRIGTRKMLDILEKICSGKGVTADLEILEKLAHSTKKGSICGLGRTAPNPVLSTLHYFRHEYEAHINGKCPSGKCPDLITYSITDDCIGCTICVQKCPVDAIPNNPYKKHQINNEKCIKCDVCKQVCPVNAVVVN